MHGSKTSRRPHRGKQILGAAQSLAIVRVGKRTFHKSWAGEGRSDLPWDLAVSTYEQVPDELLSGARYMHHVVGGKWSGIFDFFRKNPELLDRYEYFWVPDDDIKAAPEDVTRLFERVRQFGLELAQPSLSLDSLHYHHITLNNDVFAMRRTNFVELMVPVFHRDLLKKLLHMFEGNWAGLGLDMLWPNFTSDPATSVGIIDDVVVGHHGPLGTFLYRKMRSAGIIPMVEYRKNAKRFNIKPRLPFAHGGIRTDGTVMDNRFAMFGEYVGSHVRNRNRIVHNPVTAANIARLVYAYFDSYRDTIFIKPSPASVQMRTLI